MRAGAAPAAPPVPAVAPLTANDDPALHDPRQDPRDLAIPIGARARLAGARIGRRWPTVFLGIAIASFAVGPQWVLASHLPYRLLMLAIPAQQLLLVAAAAANAGRYGLGPGSPAGRCLRSCCCWPRACWPPTATRG